MRRLLAATAICAITAVGASGAQFAQAAPPPSTAPPGGDPGDVESGVSGGGDAPPITLPLVPIPVGCQAPALPQIVFVGEVQARDQRSVTFRIESIRAGRPEPYGTADAIQVRYGLDAQYLDDGQRYLVSASVQPVLGVLVSRVTDRVDDFGGDEVIGVSESDVACPRFEDPTRTLDLDGTSIAAGLLEPFWRAKLRLLGAIALPIGLAAAGVFVLAALRLGASGLSRRTIRS